tara:strand:+ start:1791 stop:2015 length:225 start_codon:yes stop_codon:yes gene_type:complete
MGFGNLFGLLKEQDYDLPDPNVVQARLHELQEQMLTATGSEYTRLVYTVANTMQLLRICRSARRKGGKWVWVND